MKETTDAVLQNVFHRRPEETQPIKTRYRHILTPLPNPQTLEQISATAELFPLVNCYQPPILWDRADGFQVYDSSGNCWIDFSSTAVMTNSGHGHPAIRKAIREHADSGLLSQFSFASEIRVTLARRLLDLAPSHCEKVFFCTTGSEANECAFRLVREWGLRKDPEKHHVLTFAGDYHGWTLGAHQLSGDSARKPWLASPDEAIHHLSFPQQDSSEQAIDSDAFFERNMAELTESGVQPNQVAAVFIETVQGSGVLPFPVLYMQRLRRWADEHDVLLVFDEVQTGFGRTGTWFGHEHYGVRADVICIGKGLTSSLPLAAVLGPADVLDLLSPAEITTTHAAHPLSCAAALANLDVLESENLIEESARKGELARTELRKLQERFPKCVAAVSGLGLLHAVHVRNPQTGNPDRELARDWTWAAVKQGVMLFHTNRADLKICPPLVIADEALVEGITAIGDALETLQT